MKLFSKLLAFSMLLFALGSKMQAQELIEVLPVTNQILYVYFTEGHIDYNGIVPGGDLHTGPFEGGGSNRIYYNLMNEADGSNTSSYEITSSDDANYSSAKNPQHVGYKAKGIDFHGRLNTPPFLRGFSMYLYLPNAMVSGNTYTLTTKNDICQNKKSVTFTFDEQEIRSPAIHLNQVGFTTTQPKYAFLSQWMGNFNYAGHNGGLSLGTYVGGKSYHLYDLDSKSIVKTYTNNIASNYSGGTQTNAVVYECDFSDFTTPGFYVLVVDGFGCSYPFEIRDDIHREGFHKAMRSMYFSRQGIVKRVDEYNNQLYPRSQHPDDVQYYYDPTQTGTGHDNTDEGVFDYTSNPVDGIWGHYYDAGDWDYYGKSHFKAPLSLLILYSAKPEAFADGDIGNHYKLSEADGSWIDEGANGVPDLLDEGRWMVDFYKRTKDALISAGYTTNGIPSYIGREGGHSGPSWHDDRNMAVKAVHGESTAAYAAAAAYLAYCLNVWHKDIQGNSGDHPEFSSWVTEAESAYNWAASNGAGGNNTKRMMASAALFAATGNTTYETNFMNAWNNNDNTNFQRVSPSELNFASAMYLLGCADIANSSNYNTVQNNMVTIANKSANDYASYHFRHAGKDSDNPPYYNSATAMNYYTVTHGFYSMVAHAVTGDNKYLNDMYAMVDYQLGGNPQNMSYMTGLGDYHDDAVFLIDAWYLFDYNSKVYSNPLLPGYTAYNAFTTNFSIPGGNGDEYWGREACSPWYTNWPYSEQRWLNRYSIAGSEFTIHQNNIWQPITYGYLCSTGQSKPDISRPTVSLDLTYNQQLDRLTPQTLTTTASASTYKVEYYWDWHYIGSSTDAAGNFAYDLDISETSLQEYDRVTITAVAYDKKGYESMPSDAGDEQVIIIEGAIDSQDPTNPTGLAADAVRHSDVDLSWTPSTDNVGVIEYEVFNADTFFSTFAGPASSVTLQGLAPGVSFTLKIRAKDAVDNVSGFSNTISFTTPSDSEDPSPPQSPYARFRTTNSIKLAWTDAIDNSGVIDHYEVFLDGVSQGTISGTDFTFGGLAVNTQYTMCVKAFDQAGNESNLACLQEFTRATEPAIEAPQASGAITVDGVISEDDWNLPFEVTKLTAGTSSNNTAIFGFTWDANYLYVACEVQDDILYPGGAASPWNDDAVEVYFDGDNSSGTSYDGNNDVQITKAYGSTDQEMFIIIGNLSAYQHAWADVPGGYSVEIAIPWAEYGQTAAINKVVGIDVGFDDDDNDGNRESQMMAWGTKDNWKDPSTWANLKLVGPTSVVNVTGVTLDKATLDMFEGNTSQLFATVSPIDATNKKVTWSSDDPSVASVSTSGLVTAEAPGTATITVTTEDGGHTATCAVSVTGVGTPVTGVSLDQNYQEILPSGSFTLSATVEPSNADDKGVTWSSTAPSVATVVGGAVSGVADGTTYIIVNTNDGNFKDTCMVVVRTPVDGVSLDQTSIVLGDLETVTLVATVTPAEATNKAVSWTSSNPAAATVDQNGVVSGVDVGTTTITVTTNDGNYTANATVDVVKKNIAPSMTPIPDMAIAMDAPQQTVNMSLINDGNNWANILTIDATSSNTSIIPNPTVDYTSGSPSGELYFTPATGQSGEVMIIVTLQDDGGTSYGGEDTFVDTFNVTVIGLGEVPGVIEAEDFVRTNSTTVTTDGVSDSPASNVVQFYQVGDILEYDVNINQSGVYTASFRVASGDANGTATSLNLSSSGGANVSNSVPNTGAGLSGWTTYQTVSFQVTLAAGSQTLYVENTGPVAWNFNWMEFQYSGAKPVTGVNLDQTSITEMEDETFELNETVVPSDATDKSVVWTSSDETVATVDQTGLVTLVNAGSAVITVTTNDGGFTATCDVTVTPRPEYTLTINVSNGSVTKAPNQSTYKLGETVELTAIPDAGYIFVNWSGDVSGSSNPLTVLMDSDKVIDCNTQLDAGNNYTLDVNSNNGTITLVPDQAIYASGTVVSITANPDPGYQFDSWTGDASGTNTTLNITMDGNKVINANYSLIPYAIDTTTPQNGTIEFVSGFKQTYYYGEMVIVKAIPDQHFKFNNWTGVLTSSNLIDTFYITGNEVLSADFGYITYNLAIEATNGSITKVPDKTVYNSGETVQLTAVPDPTYKFTGWSGDVDSFDKTISVTFDSDVSLSCEFTEIMHFLGITAENGTVLKEPNKNQYHEGSTVILTAVPDSGFVFVEWQGDVSGTDNPVAITMDSQKSVTAVFSDGTSVQEQKLDIALFPNPALDKINVALNARYDKIRIVNVLGELIREENLESTIQTFDVSGLEAGVYFIQIVDNRQLKGAVKFMKE